ncbi:MAG TPA: putative toxin-antitoxin system toxin component, PIN family [Terracidiphilus sp.]|nr:putative toxin-antitoxin system toxin component, PIN family [Terracidiphilus sp.]
MNRVVFDTNTVVSALLFPRGRLAWLRDHWRERGCIPLLSRATAAELDRVLAYPKFQLSLSDRVELMGDYLPICRIVEVRRKCAQKCRDPRDQIFLDLAFCGDADALVTGDRDLLALADATRFRIETPESYRMSVEQR